jgi:hypothetical protein
MRGRFKEVARLLRRAQLTETIVAGADSIKREIDYPASLEDLNSIIGDCREGAERIRDIVQNLRTFRGSTKRILRKPIFTRELIRPFVCCRATSAPIISGSFVITASCRRLILFPDS